MSYRGIGRYTTRIYDVIIRKEDWLVADTTDWRWWRSAADEIVDNFLFSSDSFYWPSFEYSFDAHMLWKEMIKSFISQIDRRSEMMWNQQVVVSKQTSFSVFLLLHTLIGTKNKSLKYWV